MKNIRRFQRATLIGFIGINSVVYTEMKEFALDEQVLFVSSVVITAMILVFIFSILKKTGKKNKSIAD